MAIQILMNGQDITQYVYSETFNLDVNIGQGVGMSTVGSGRTSTCNFVCKLGPMNTAPGAGTAPATPCLVRQGEVIVKDGATVIYGGYATTLEDVSTRTIIKTDVTCNDYWQQLDRLHINELFESTNDLTVLATVLNKYAPWVDTSVLTGIVPYANILRKLYRGESVQKVIRDICKISGCIAWVDNGKKFHYELFTNAAPAAFSVSTEPDMLSSFPYSITKFTIDDSAVINRVWFFGGKYLSSDFTQDLSYQANGSNKIFILGYYPHIATDGKIHVYVGGVEINAGRANGAGTSADTLISQGGSANCLVSTDAKNIIFDVAPTSSAPNYVQCKYRYEVPLVYQMTNPESYQFFGQYYDGRIVDDTVYDLTTAQKRANALMNENAMGLPQLKLVTRFPGLQVGTLLHVVHPLRGINSNFLIQQVTPTWKSSQYVTYEITCGAFIPDVISALVQTMQATQPMDNTTDTSLTVINYVLHNSNMGVHVTSPHSQTGVMGTYTSGYFNSGYATI